MIKQNNSHRILGIMSGTSMDGIDFCLAEFKPKEEEWKYKIIKTETFQYSEIWLNFLNKAPSLAGEDLIHSHFQYGKFIGEQSNDFIRRHNVKVDLIASHGHTIYHQTEKGFTFQLGKGSCIAAETGLPVVSDFRSLDVALGGQGAPLVPFGDLLLFPNYDYCLNFGGICNISILEKGNPIAYDICPCNMVLNYYTKKHFGYDFDMNGKIAAGGKFNQTLFDQLNQTPYYGLNTPKSMGRELVFSSFISLIDQSNIPPEDILNTFCRHISYQIGLAMNDKKGSALITGGGVKNNYLIDLIQKKGIQILIPDEQLIEFKEALIFAFLGLRRFQREINTLKSVTGSKVDSSGGSLFFP